MSKINNLTSIALAPTATLNSAITQGVAVDRSRLHGVGKAVLNSTATGGAGQTADVKLQHSDSEAGPFTDTGVEFAQVTSAEPSHQEVTFSMDRLKRWVRTVTTLSAGATVSHGVVLLGFPHRT